MGSRDRDTNFPLSDLQESTKVEVGIINSTVPISNSCDESVPARGRAWTCGTWETIIGLGHGVVMNFFSLLLPEVAFSIDILKFSGYSLHELSTHVPCYALALDVWGHPPPCFHLREGHPSSEGWEYRSSPP